MNSCLKSLLIKYTILAIVLIFVFAPKDGVTQGFDTEMTKTGRIWAVASALGLGQAATSAAAGWFPADFNIAVCSGNDGNAGARTITIYLRNYQLNPDSVIEKIGVNPIDGRFPDYPNGIVLDPIKSYVRYDYAKNTVDGELVQTVPLGQIDPGKMIGTSDQLISVIYKYPIGVKAERKIFAWSQENHDDYLVVDFTFTNESDQTFQDVMFTQEWGLPDYSWGQNPPPSGLTPDHYAWWHYYGAMPSDSQRVYYAYHADDPQQSGDTMGRPAFTQEGRLINPGAPFYGFLHISKNPYTDPANDEDDILQPITTYVAKSGELSGVAGEDFDRAFGQLSDQNPLPGAIEGTHHEINNDQAGSPNHQDFSPNVTLQSGVRAYIAFGPYKQWAPGESIHYVYIVGHAGLSLEMATEIGKKLVDGTVEAPPNLPDPNTGFFPSNFQFPSGAAEKDIKKDLWLSTVIDSVHKTMYRARWNWEHKWNVPGAPPPPDVDVNALPGRVEVKWTCPDVEAMENFAGYRVMRRKSNLDTAFFEIVKTFPADDKADVHVYEDLDAQLGGTYYYFVQSAIKVAENDFDALPKTRGSLLWSGRGYAPTTLDVVAKQGGAGDLSNVIIAPNPYNFNDPVVQNLGATGQRRIIFFNITSYCEIDIYTENGDHVIQIVHDDPSGSDDWNMLSKNQQVIASGVYIAVFKDKNGGVAYRKFAVAR